MNRSKEQTKKSIIILKDFHLIININVNPFLHKIKLFQREFLENKDQFDLL